MRFLLLALLFLVSVANAEYAQMSSDINQADGIVTFDNIDGLDGIDYEMYTGLTVLERGLYMIVSAPQTGVGRGCLANWLEVNREQVANSNILLCQPANQPMVGVSQGVACLAGGDVVNVLIDGKIVAFFPEGQPTIPSIIFTMYRVSDC